MTASLSLMRKDALTGMTFRWILTIFVCFFNEVLSMHVDDVKQERSCQKLNVVLFFANSCNVPKEAPAVKCLGMHEIARVKHSISQFPVESNMFRVIQRNTPDCTEMLKEGLSSLTHFCQNALGMKTAVVSVSSQEITKEIKEDQEVSEKVKHQIPSPENFLRIEVLPKFKDTIHALTKSKSPNIKEIVTVPENTEVFNIRVKRELAAKNETPGEIKSIPLENQNKPNPWDVLNFMGQIKYSFFGKLFEDADKNKLAEEENNLPKEITDTNEDPGLFDSVKSTLTSLQETPGEFLLVVFGGHLSELSNNNSPLVQSVKHVTESTDSQNTLIVLTGTCSNQKGAREATVTITEGTSNGKNNNSGNSIPVFVTGPKSEKLKDCAELQDVPHIVKSILEETSPNFEESRQRRSIFSGTPINRKRLYHNHAAPQLHLKDYSVIIHICATILFIL